MSLMRCAVCGERVDTDADPDSLYVRGLSGECACRECRDEFQLSTEFEEVSHYA